MLDMDDTGKLNQAQVRCQGCMHACVRNMHVVAAVAAELRHGCHAIGLFRRARLQRRVQV